MLERIYHFLTHVIMGALLACLVLGALYSGAKLFWRIFT